MDDRKVFVEEQRENARRMAADEGLARKALAVATEADRYGYSYFWTWLGVPIIQIPPDIIAMQEMVWSCRPQVIVETGVARGGSLILFASLLQLLGDGLAIGVDVDIRAHNRRTIEEHALGHRIRLVEGSSTVPATLEQVRELTRDSERVMVVLDSDHTHDHVLRELRSYGPLVTPGQYLVVADTIVEDLPPQTHRPRPWGPGDNPRTALDAFLRETDRFEADEDINAKLLMTSNPGGYLRCIRS